MLFNDGLRVKTKRRGSALETGLCVFRTCWIRGSRSDNLTLADIFAVPNLLFLLKLICSRQKLQEAHIGPHYWKPLKCQWTPECILLRSLLWISKNRIGSNKSNIMSIYYGKSLTSEMINLSTYVLIGIRWKDKIDKNCLSYQPSVCIV